MYRTRSANRLNQFHQRGQADHQTNIGVGANAGEPWIARTPLALRLNVEASHSWPPSALWLQVFKSTAEPTAMNHRVAVGTYDR